MQRVRHRRGGGLAQDRARDRISAFVYGNITVLGAVVALTPSSVESGQGSVVVAATAGTTFISHLVSDRIAAKIGVPAESDRPQPLRSEFRDAMPIATTALLPFVLLLLAAVDVLPAWIALAIAALTVVVRLAATGLVVERISGHRSRTGVWAGFSLALGSAVIAGVKALLTH